MNSKASAPSSSQAQDPAAGILASLLERGFKRTHALVCLLRAMTGALRARILLWGGESDSEKSHRQQNGDSRIRHSIFSPLSSGSARFLMGRLYETQPILLSH